MLNRFPASVQAQCSVAAMLLPETSRAIYRREGLRRRGFHSDGLSRVEGGSTREICVQGRISVQWLDKSDCVGAWQNEKLAAVVFCTADCLAQLRNLDGDLHSQTPSQALRIVSTAERDEGDANCLQSKGCPAQDKTLGQCTQWVQDLTSVHKIADMSCLLS